MSHFMVVLLLSCILIHIQILRGNNWIGYAFQGSAPLFLTLFQGVSYLLFPFCGWIAEVYISRLWMLRCSFVVVFISSIILFSSSSVLILVRHFVDDVFASLSGGIFVITGLIGLGIYESNAIQFGMDQMLESSSEQLSSFIHWYFWCVNIGPLIIYYAILGAFLYFSSCAIKISAAHSEFGKLFGWLSILQSILQLFTSSFGIIIFSY